MPVDFNPILAQTPESGTNRGLSFFSNALDAVLQRRAAMQRQEQEIQAQKEAAALVDKRTREINAAQVAQQKEQQARIAEHERVTEEQARQAAAEVRRQHQAEIMTKIPDMIGKGQSGAVPGVLGAAGIGVSPKPLPEQLAQPVEAPQAAVSGLPFAGLMDVTSPAAAVAERKRQQDAQKFSENNAVLQFEGGRTQDLDMGGMTPTARAEVMKQALSSLPDTDPNIAQAKAAIPAMTSGLMVKPGEEVNLYRDAVKETGMNKRAQMAADAARARVTQEKPGQIKDDARADIKFLADQHNLKALEQARTNFDKMSAMGDAAVRNGNNAIAAQAFMGMYTKFAQGEVGVLNDQDIKTFWTNAGSPEERTQEALEKLLTGGLGSDKREKALKAIAELRGVIQSRVNDIYKQIVPTMEQYGSTGDNYMRGVFGKGLPKFEKARKAEAEAKAKALLESGGF